ncbi:secreted protein [Streptomyces lividans TK24]|nr:secreted protein [Streptomyces lividans TK24]
MSPAITHFKGWYVTEGTTGEQTVSTDTTTVIAVSVGLNDTIETSFAVEALSNVKATVGLDVKLEYTSTSKESNSVTWNLTQPGYYGFYKGTKKVTGTYGSLNCNRTQQDDGSWALEWTEGPGSGSFTTFTTLEEGAVRCQDSVPADSIMAKAQALLDCGSAAAKTDDRAGAAAPTAQQKPDRLGQRPAPTSGASAEQPRSTGHSARAALDCSAEAYKIAVPGKPLSWGAPLLADDGVRLRPSSIFSAHLDNWRLCNVTEQNGVLEASLWNWGNGGCATVAEENAATDRAVLRTVPCAEDDLQRFYIYRDVPGSPKIGVQNKYTGSMMGYDRYADGEFIRQYSSGRQDGSGTFDLIGV